MVYFVVNAITVKTTLLLIIWVILKTKMKMDKKSKKQIIIDESEERSRNAHTSKAANGAKILAMVIAASV